MKDNKKWNKKFNLFFISLYFVVGVVTLGTNIVIFSNVWLKTNSLTTSLLLLGNFFSFFFITIIYSYIEV
jgi:hypothetical protein